MSPLVVGSSGGSGRSTSTPRWREQLTVFRHMTKGGQPLEDRVSARQYVVLQFGDFSLFVDLLEAPCRFADVCFRRPYGTKNAPFIPAVYLLITERELMNHTNGWMNGMNGWMGGGNGWMGGGTWLWTVIGVLVVVLLVVLISNVSRKSL